MVKDEKHEMTKEEKHVEKQKFVTPSPIAKPAPDNPPLTKEQIEAKPHAQALAEGASFEREHMEPGARPTTEPKPSKDPKGTHLVRSKIIATIAVNPSTVSMHPDTPQDVFEAGEMERLRKALLDADYTSDQITVSAETTF